MLTLAAEGIIRNFQIEPVSIKLCRIALCLGQSLLVLNIHHALSLIIKFHVKKLVHDLSTIILNEYGQYS